MNNKEILKEINDRESKEIESSEQKYLDQVYIANKYKPGLVEKDNSEINYYNC